MQLPVHVWTFSDELADVDTFVEELDNVSPASDYTYRISRRRVFGGKQL